MLQHDLDAIRVEEIYAIIDIEINYTLCFQMLLISKAGQDVHKTLSEAGRLIEQFSGTPVQKESLKVFFLILQVCHFLMAGQV